MTATVPLRKRFHKIVLDEFYRVALRKKVYREIAELQDVVDAAVEAFDHAARHCPRSNGATWLTVVA